jgi:hypothetical protein
MCIKHPLYVVKINIWQVVTVKFKATICVERLRLATKAGANVLRTEPGFKTNPYKIKLRQVERGM